MQRRSQVALGITLVSLLVSWIAPPAFSKPADETPDEAGQYIVIYGTRYGPEDGLEIDEYTSEVSPGSDPIFKQFPTDIKPGQVTPYVAWGSSYATTSESLQLRYTTKAKAAANVYQGKRIIQVCVWYTRDNKRVGKKSCSNANARSGIGDWTPGPVVSHSVWDTLNPVAPKTKWHYSTARVNPYTGRS